MLVAGKRMEHFNYFFLRKSCFFGRFPAFYGQRLVTPGPPAVSGVFVSQPQPNPTPTQPQPNHNPTTTQPQPNHNPTQLECGTANPDCFSKIQIQKSIIPLQIGVYTDK